MMLSCEVCADISMSLGDIAPLRVSASPSSNLHSKSALRLPKHCWASGGVAVALCARRTPGFDVEGPCITATDGSCEEIW